MNVLFLAQDFVLPAESGARVRTLSQLRILSAMPDVERMTVLSLAGSAVPPERVEELRSLLPKAQVEAPVVRPARIRSSARTFARFLRLRLLRRMPYVAAICESDALHALVQKHLLDSTYDVVYLGAIGMMAYASDVRRLAPHARLVLEQHNVEWQIFDRLAGSFQAPLRQATQLEALATRRFERHSLRAVDSVIAISEADARGFRDLAGIDAVVVPPFIVPSAPRSEATHSRRLGYIGHLGWQPNAYGLDWFCRDVWPHVRELVPDVTLTIAGPGLRKRADGSLAVPQPWVRPGITTVGFVPDLEDVYRGALAMVAPVVGGSGVRMKLLETMSAGMPTVTTADGAAGLAVTDGTQVLIADEPRRFAEKVAQVLSDAAVRERLRQGGYKFLRDHHSAEATQSRLRRALTVPRPTAC